MTAGAALAIGGSALLRQTSQASDMVSIGSPWRVIRSAIHLAVTGTAATDIVKAGAVALAVLLAVLLIRGLAGPVAGRARRPGAPGGRGPGRYATIAFALALAWLFAWPYVLPWYDALGWALLPLAIGGRRSRASAGCCSPGPRRSASATCRPGRPTRRCRPGSAGCSRWSGTG